MRFALLGALLVTLFTVGCGASQAHDASADVMNDPSWQPPGQGDLTVGADPEPKAKPRPRRPRHLEQPNRREMPARGLHAQNP
jgi:hypothetical protein